MSKYRLTITGVIISLFTYFIEVSLELNLFQQFLGFLRSCKKFNLLELIIPLIIFIVFLSMDISRQNQLRMLKKAKFKIYKAMLCSSHHILNNFIYQMSIFKITAEHTPGFDPKTLAYYEDIIDNTSDQIHSLSTIKDIDEYSIRTSVMNNK